MATFKIDSITPGPRANSYFVNFTTFVMVNENMRSLPDHTYLFDATNPSEINSKCQAVADHDESELNAVTSTTVPAGIAALIGV